MAARQRLTPSETPDTTCEQLVKPPADRRYTTREVPAVVKQFWGIDVAPSTLDTLRCLGRGARFYRGPGRCVTYRFGDLAAYYQGSPVLTVDSVDVPPPRKPAADRRG